MKTTTMRPNKMNWVAYQKGAGLFVAGLAHGLDVPYLVERALARHAAPDGVRYRLKYSAGTWTSADWRTGHTGQRTNDRIGCDCKVAGSKRRREESTDRGRRKRRVW